MVVSNDMRDQFKITGADKAGLWIFGIAVIVRAAMQWAPHEPGAMIDYAWITNFAAIAAGWLSIRSRVGDTAKVTERVETQTNGQLDERIASIVTRVLAEQTKQKGY